MMRIRVASRRDLKENRGVGVRVHGQEIALFKQGEDMYAVRNECAHQHFAVLHEGVVERCTATCPMHGWTYDLRTGKSTTGQGKIATYPVTIQGEDVFVEIEEID